MAKKRRKKKGALRPWQVLYRILVALSAVVVALFVVWKLAVRPPEVPTPPPPALPSTQATDNPDTPEVDESLATPAPSQEWTRKKYFYTFLLAASDQVSGNSDTIMVCSYDVPNQKVSLVSIPRDTLVDGKHGKYSYHKINAAYAFGGVDELKEAVSNLLGIPIDFYVTVDLKAFVEIVDAVGGVDFQVPVYMDYDAPDQDLHIHYEPKMYYGLSGQQVLEIARCRKNTIWYDKVNYDLYDAYPDADIGRTRTQQQIMVAIAKKLISWNSLTKIGAYVDIFNRNVKTDMTLDNLLYFASEAMGVDTATGVSTATFPGDGTITYKGTTWCYQYDLAEAMTIINTMLNPYTADLTAEMTGILQVK